MMALRFFSTQYFKDFSLLNIALHYVMISGNTDREYSIADPTGRQIGQGILYHQQLTRINTSTLANGFYYLLIDQNGVITREKFNIVK